MAAAPASNDPSGDPPEGVVRRVRFAERPAQFEGHGPVGDGLEHGPDDLQGQIGPVHHVPAALLGHDFLNRAGEVEVDDVEAHVAQDSRRPSHDRRDRCP